MTTTPNLGLTKDAETDLYSVGRVNANSDRIDDFAGAITSELSRKAATGDVYGEGTVMSPTAEDPIDLDSITSFGKYTYAQESASYVTNLPLSAEVHGFSLTVSAVTAQCIRQTLYYADKSQAGVFYERLCIDDEWTPWYKFAGEAVT